LPATIPWCRPPPDSIKTSEHEPGPDTGENQPATSANKQTNEEDTQSGVAKGVRDNNTSVHIEVEQATSGPQITQPTNRKWVEFSAHLMSVTNDTTKKLELYLASIDSTLKELGPHLAKVDGAI